MIIQRQMWMLGHIHKYCKNVLALSWCCYRKINGFTWKEKLTDGFCSPPTYDELGKEELSLSLLSQQNGVFSDWYELLTASNLYSVASMPIVSPAEVDLAKLKILTVFISNVDWVRKVSYRLTDKYLVMSNWAWSS